ncbi:hypothetical protein F4679DRAFT_564540 [Xylaria curta]|nr:hypothetical protein F4679DRAFT_564540 [Xylaria curta]
MASTTSNQQSTIPRPASPLPQSSAPFPRSLAPFRPGDQFSLPVSGVAYYPDHPLTRQLNQACADNDLQRFQNLVAEWWRAANPSPPRGPHGYDMATLEPCLYHAIRLDRSAFVAYLLDHGVLMSRLAASEAIEHRCSTAMWDAFLQNGGLDLNAAFHAEPPHLAYVLHDEALVQWFLSHGADPNAESEWGLSPFLRAVGHAPLSIVKLLHRAGGSPAYAVAFVCQPSPSVADAAGSASVPRDERLQVLRYLLDHGADPDVPKWTHNRKGVGSDFQWGSPLNAALSSRRADLAEELLRRGARTDIPTFNIASRGETALELAARRVPSLVPLIEECREKGRYDNAEGYH